jgi:LAO/AO transport system kinase
MSTKIAEEVLEGSERSAARLISLIERGDRKGYEALVKLVSCMGKAHIVGITGSGGAGKSTLMNALALHFLKEGREIGIVAIDPSDASGEGSLLGDRLRMKGAEEAGRIFIRSMAQRNYPGGVCRAAIGAIYVMEAMGKELLMVESIGAGQSDREVTNLADTIITVFTPEFGDEIQLMKAGLLEIGDIVVVNKADKAGAEDLMMALMAYAPRTVGKEWKIPVLLTQAHRDEGVAELARQVKLHGEFLGMDRRSLRGEKYARFALSILKEEVWKVFLNHLFADQSLGPALDEIRLGRLDPYNAVDRIAKEFGEILEGKRLDRG